MSAPAYGTVTWFQIGAADPDGAERFYGGLFGWSFQPDPIAGDAYRLIGYPGAEEPSGGILGMPDGSPGHAVFAVVVEDVAATAAEAERLGGKVVQEPFTTPSGLVSAMLNDAGGNLFAVFSPPPA